MSAPNIPFWQAFRFWLKLGFISFGGPAGQIATLHAELVERRKWISNARFLHALNYCMVLPGPEAQQLATYLGWLMHRTWGGIVAGVLFVLPSLVLLIVLSYVYITMGHTPLVAALFYGIKPTVVAIVAHAAHRVGGKVLTQPWLWCIAVAAFIAITVLHIAFPYIVLAAAGVGYAMQRISPHKFKAVTPAHSTAAHTLAQPHSSWVIDDHTALPKHCAFSMSRFCWVVAIGLSLWVASTAGLYFGLGSEHTYTHMAWFFTKAALMTFGGAYAVLPYVYQGAVSQYGWLSPTQMVDGLALGESTPGPLIMVVAFVGFIGAYTPTVLGQEHLVLAAVLGACIVTWFTFLPSFIFILAGAPLIESTRTKLSFTASLTAISAAVTGVIANLGLFFAYHVWWPNGISTLVSVDNFARSIDWVAVGLSVLAAIALFYGKRSVLQVIAASAVLGVVLKLLV